MISNSPISTLVAAISGGARRRIAKAKLQRPVMVKASDRKYFVEAGCWRRMNPDGSVRSRRLERIAKEKERREKVISNQRKRSNQGAQ